MTPIGDAVARELSELGHFTEHAIQRVRHHKPYDSTDTATTGAPVSLTDPLKTDLTDGLSYVEGFVGRLKTAAPDIISGLTKAEEDAAKVQRYEANPVFAEVVEMLESFPEAGSAIRVAMAGVKALAAAAPAEAQPAA